MREGNSFLKQEGLSLLLVGKILSKKTGMVANWEKREEILSHIYEEISIY